MLISYLKKLLCVSIILASPILVGMAEALKPKKPKFCQSALRGRFDLVEKEIQKGENPNYFFSPQHSLLDMVIRNARSVPENPCIQPECLEMYREAEKKNYIKTAQLLYQYGAEVRQNKGNMLPRYLKGANFENRPTKDRLALY